MTATATVLVVCTGNTCRSPLAAALLAEHAARVGMALGIGTAGLIAPGQPLSDGTARVLAERGLEVPAHRSRQLTAELVDGADLVVGMTREHVRSAVLMRPAAFGRSFTLRELVGRAHELGARPPEMALSDWLRAAHDGRTAAWYLRDEPTDDITDPLGRPIGAFRSLADELDALTGRLVDLVLAGAGGAGGGGGVAGEGGVERARPEDLFGP